MKNIKNYDRFIYAIILIMEIFYGVMAIKDWFSYGALPSRYSFPIELLVLAVMPSLYLVTIVISDLKVKKIFQKIFAIFYAILFCFLLLMGIVVGLGYNVDAVGILKDFLFDTPDVFGYLVLSILILKKKD